MKICVSVRWGILWVRPPLVCVLSLEDNLRWILACCLLRFAAFFPSFSNIFFLLYLINFSSRILHFKFVFYRIKDLFLAEDSAEVHADQYLFYELVLANA